MLLIYLLILRAFIDAKKTQKKKSTFNYKLKLITNLIPHWIEELWTNISKPRTIKSFNI